MKIEKTALALSNKKSLDVTAEIQFPTLPPQLAQLMELLVAGYGVSQIAEIRGIGLRTVQRQLADIAERLAQYDERLSDPQLGTIGRAVRIALLYDRMTRAKQTRSVVSKKIGISEDWGNAPQKANFYGRQDDLAFLAGIVATNQPRLLTIFGMGGMGKTALSIKLAQNIKERFDLVVWRSLRLVPPAEQIVEDWLKMLAPDYDLSTNPPDVFDWETKIKRLLDELTNRRCLLILDNFETVLHLEAQLEKAGEAGENDSDLSVKSFRAFYQQLIEKIGTFNHQSCLILTSREKPKVLQEIEQLGHANHVVTYELKGLADNDCLKLIDAELGEIGSSKKEIQTLTDWKSLITHCAGNPLVLKLVVGTVWRGSGGQPQQFLEQETLIFSEVHDLLEQQFDRLNELEQTLLYWLTIEQDPVTLAQLHTDLLWPLSSRQLIESLQSLNKRCLIETGQDGTAYTLQPVVMEFVSEKLVALFTSAIISSINFTSGFSSGALALNTFGLLKANGKDYLRAAQQRLLVNPLFNALLVHFRSTLQVRQHLLLLLDSYRAQPKLEQGYGPGNLINLLIKLNEGRLNEIDLSGLYIRQVNFQGVSLARVDMSGSELEECLFDETFTPILGLGLNHNGQQLLAACQDGQIHGWRLPQGQPYLRVKASRDWARSVKFNSHFACFASGSDDHAVKVWNSQNGKLEYVIQHHQAQVRSVDFSPDGKLLLSSGYDGLIALWQVADGKLLRQIKDEGGRISQVIFNWAGTQLASCSQEPLIKLWDTHTANQITQLKGHNGPIWGLAFSPDDQYLASGSADRTIRIWDMANHECIRTLVEHLAEVRTVAFSPDGQWIASGDESGVIKCWDWSSGLCISSWVAHSGIISTLLFSPDGQWLISGSRDRTICIWEGRQGRLLKKLQGHSRQITALAWRHITNVEDSLNLAEELASAASDGQVQIWKTKKDQIYEEAQILTGHSGPVEALVYDPAGKLLATGGQDRAIRIWEVSVNRDKSRSSGFEQGRRLLRTLMGTEGLIRALAFQPNSPVLASGGDDGFIRLWGSNNGQLLQTWQCGAESCWSLAFSSDGTLLASASDSSTIRVWYSTSLVLDNSKTTPNYFELNGHSNWVFGLAWRPQTTELASASQDKTIRLWKTENGAGQCITTLSGHSDLVSTIAFSPDGLKLVSGSYDHSIRVWQCNNDNKNGIEWIKYMTLEGHQDALRAVNFDPSGKLIASSSDDGTVRLWDSTTGKCLQILYTQRIYEGLNLNGTHGLSEAEQETLAKLGALF